ncbi:ATP-binding protein [Paraburkholderia sp. 22099]|jgi:predicted ATPase with chaperone activity|uniref:ATPase n=1 Tax=Paraburkholderia TaxID=1822464 RepID=UPI0009F72A18|nr:ATPase [Paraburkholderia terricola]MDR6445210.1 putative ATPase with chaperone activity [Paraburkholderia terricola]ORC51771.1 ATPase [Burkholderia sp. A27]
MNQHNIESATLAQVTRLPEPAPSHGRRAEESAVSLRAPRTLAETGLPLEFVSRLVLKSALLYGKSSFAELAERHRLSIGVLDEVLAFLVREHLLEITHRGATDMDVQVRLTDSGRTLAQDDMARCRYCGPAPVVFESYVQSVREHSVRWLRITQAEVRAAFHGVVIDPALLDAAAASLNAGRPLLLHGLAGSGKTFLAERLGLLLRGNVPIPYALFVGGEIIQLYDPLVHRDAPEQEPASTADRRWRMCRRPVVISGGELTLEGLDLRYDAAAGFYQAPPHMKASMGLYIVDDLGRQRIAPHELLNRWLMPLDRGVDQFTLQSGSRFMAPFDVWPVFSSNLTPSEFDDAFLRRLGSKLYVGPLSVDDYHAVFNARCAALELTASQAVFDYLLHNLHFPSGRPFLACYPGDLLDLFSAAAHYRGAAREVTEEGLRDAWHNYFGIATDHDASYPPTADRPGRQLAAG